MPEPRPLEGWTEQIMNIAEACLGKKGQVWGCFANREGKLEEPRDRIAQIICAYTEQEVNKATVTLQADLDEWRTHRMADATGHMLRCAKVNRVWSCAKGCAVAERDALLAVAQATQAYLYSQEARRKAMEAHPKDVEQPSVLTWVMRLRGKVIDALAHPIVQRLLKENP